MRTPNTKFVIPRGHWRGTHHLIAGFKMISDLMGPPPTTAGDDDSVRGGDGGEGGFTLIELMLVVIIIGTLAAMIVPRFAGRSEDAKKAAARADVDANLSNALELYELDMGAFPSSDQGLQALITAPTGANASRWKGPYLKKKAFKDPWGNPYQYRQVDAKTFELSSAGPDGQAGTADDIKAGAE